MSVATDIRKTTERLRRTRSVRTPVPPIARMIGPRLDLTAGDPDQPFYIASIDKVLYATLIAQLFDEGRFGPDTPIGELLPAEDLAPLPAASGIDVGRDVTVQHLLSHTSGLPDVVQPPRGHTTTCSIRNIAADPGHVWTAAEFLEQARHLPPTARPGERFHYGDTAYLLLVRIVEEARASRIDEQLRSRIFEPAGMTDTAKWVGASDERVDELMSRLAPFWLEGSTPIPGEFAPNLRWQNGMGGPSTANDLVRFQRALHGGALCALAWVRLLGAPRSRLRPGIHYGTGMAALRFGGFFPLLRGYPEPTGGLGFTATHMFYYPEQQTHVVLNYHAHRRMSASFQMHVRLAGLIARHG